MSVNAEDEELEKTLRDFAERIISGEFKSLALVMLTENDSIEVFYKGGRINALGLLEHGRDRVLRSWDKDE